MKTQSVKSNFIYQFLYQFLVSFLPFFTSPYLARVLGASNIGIYSYVYSIVAIFLLFSNLGLQSYGDRLIAKNRDLESGLSKAFSSLLYLHISLSVITFIIYIISIIVLQPQNMSIFCIQGFFILANMFDISWFFWGIENFKITVTRNSLIKIVSTLLVFVFVRTENDLWIYTSIMAIGLFLSQISLWFFVFKFTKLIRVKISELIVHIKPMLVLFTATIAVTIYSYMDKIMLGSMTTMDQLGYYENAWKIIEFPVGFITALSNVMIPKISNLVINNDNKKVNEYLSKSMKFSMITSIGLFFGLLSIASEFSTVFWGEKFATSGTVICVLAVCVIFISWNSVIRSQYIIPNELDRIYVYAVILGGITNLIVNYFFIPRFGAVGAAIGTIFSYLLIFMTQNIMVSKSVSLKKFFIQSLPYYLCGAFMFTVIKVASLFLDYGAIGLIIKVVVGVTSYGIIVTILAFATHDEFIIYNIKYFIKLLAKSTLHRR